ncbi:MAG: hypothetical protein KC583_08080 [Myxococcales bacterium]|nr:hypothetical protein [Myxococcales bacterium]
MARRHPWIRPLIFAILAAGGLTACAMAVPGGVLGGALTALATTVALLLLGGSQAGCEQEDTNPGPGVDAEVDADAQVPPSDGGVDEDMYVGPCLQPPLEDLGPSLDAAADAGPDASPDAAIGPCLDIEADVGPCLEADAHIGPCLSPPQPDAYIGPCLSPPAPDGGFGALEPDERPAPVASDRDAVLKRVLGERALPADVVARLGGASGETDEDA